MRNEFVRLEKIVSDKEGQISFLKNELELFHKLYNHGERYFKYGDSNGIDFKALEDYKVDGKTYHKIPKLIDGNEKEIAELEKSLPEERQKLKNTSDILTAFEKIESGTFVQSLIEDEKNRRQSNSLMNGLKRAD